MGASGLRKAAPSGLRGGALDLVGNDGVTYGHVSFSRLTANSDGSSSLQGTFWSGTLSIPVFGTVGPYQWGGSSGFTAIGTSAL